MLADNPDDAFLTFALATELRNAGRLEAAVETFTALRERHPDYLGLYYHLGAVLLELGRVTAADEVFADGIARARRLGDHHTLSELQNIRTNASLGL